MEAVEIVLMWKGEIILHIMVCVCVCVCVVQMTS